MKRTLIILAIALVVIGGIAGIIGVVVHKLTPTPMSSRSRDGGTLAQAYRGLKPPG